LFEKRVVFLNDATVINTVKGLGLPGINGYGESAFKTFGAFGYKNLSVQN
jgi:hypothetical protein